MDELDLIEPDRPEIPEVPRHRVRAIAATLVLVGLVVGGVLFARRDGDTATPTPTAVTKEITVERGDLTDTQSVDGSLVETDTIAVVHRIDGQTTSFTDTPSSSGSNTANTGAAPPAAAAAGAALPATATDAVTSSRVQLSLALSTVEVAAAIPVDTTASTTTTPTTTPTTATTPATTAPATTTPAPPTTPGGTVPPVTTTPGGPPRSTVPGGPPGSVPTGGGGGSVPSGGGGATTGRGGATSGGAATVGTGVGTVTQVVTGVARAHDDIRSGDVLYTVESQPVIALRGALPAWRTMTRSSAAGNDIQQLEAALVALGYDVDGKVTVDEEWDSATTAMVKRWQRGLGVDDTGEVTLGSVVFIAHDATVASVDVAIGDAVQDGTGVLELTGTQQQVIITVPDELRASLAPSTPVQLADGTGVVTRLRSAEADDGSTSVEALITPDAPIDATAGTSIKVTLTTSIATSALLVQTDAVVSMLDGSYALEVPDPDGGHHFVVVTVLGVSGSRTAIRGDGVDAGMAVLAPA